MIERRQHRRIVTLKNFGWLLAGLVVVFIGLTIDRHTRADGFGRIMDRQIAPNDDIRPTPQVITEAPPVPDQNSADPLLLASAAREQEFLSTTPATPAPPAPVAAAQITPMSATGSGSVSIVQDASGVTIVRHGDAKRPVLSGGIFKQP